MPEDPGPEAVVNVSSNGAAADDDSKLPFQPMALVFSDLSYYVPKPGGERGQPPPPASLPPCLAFSHVGHDASLCLCR